MGFVARDRLGLSCTNVSRIKQFPLTTTDWAPIVAPQDCNYYLIIGNQDGTVLLRCSDPADPTSAYTIRDYFALVVPPVSSPRFKAGDTVTYLKAQSGTGPAIVEFYS